MTEVSRHLLIAILLQTSDWYLDEFSIRPRGSNAGSGAGAERKVTCPKCQGCRRTRSGNRCGSCWHGEPLNGHTCEPCPKCKGKGRVNVNDYLPLAERYTPIEKEVKRAARHENAEIRRELNERGLAIPKGGLEARRTRGAKAKRQRDRQDLADTAQSVSDSRDERNKSGSYEVLERLLCSLKQSDEVAHYLVLAYFREQRWGRPLELLRPTELLDGKPRPSVRVASLGYVESVALVRGIVFLDKGMPKDIRVPREFLAPLETRAGVSITRQAGSKSGRARSRVRRWAA